jgi:hypothetical protein
MNKKLTLKSLLVASLMAMGSVSAWATEVTATLLHTAAVQGGSNAAGTSLDAATHYYNMWGTSGWVAQAYIGFTAEIPTGEATQNSSSWS